MKITKNTSLEKLILLPKEETTTEHYAILLGLSFPWIVEKTELNKSENTLTITVAYKKGEKAECPVVVSS